MLSIITIEQSENGAVDIHEDRTSELKAMTARVTRTKTLDGGVAIVHSGFSHGDRTLNIKAECSQDQADALEAIFRQETLVYISTRDGFYSGAISYLSTENGELAMTVLLKEKLSA